MLEIFKTKPLISDESAHWILDTFQWCLSCFDRQEFYQRTRLVLPNNDFFPGDVSSIHEKASNIFEHCKTYAGLNHWPFVLQPLEYFDNRQPPLIQPSTLERNSGQNRLPVVADSVAFPLSYHPQQVMKAGDLAASFAHIFAQHLLYQSQQTPPGGMEYFPEATEVLAIFMGFGVLMANSAYTFRGGCGSCYNAMANRQASLAESEVVFALAVFCTLKNIPDKEITANLKKYLKSPYKQAIKQLKGYQDQLSKMASRAA